MDWQGCRCRAIYEMACSVNPDSLAIANEETIKITGFTFDGNNTAFSLITGSGAGINSTKPFKNLIIGNNKFQNMNTTTSGNGVISLLSGETSAGSVQAL
jgi:hypothetical protein